MKLQLLPLLLCLVSFSLFADTRTVDRTWLGLFGKSSISEKAFIWNEAQFRLDNDGLTLQQLLLRPGLLWRFNDRFEGGLLYGFIQTDGVNEHRPTFQLQHPVNLSADKFLTLRHRLEFRHREDIEAESIRYRALFRYQHPVSSQNSLIFWDEPFLNVTREDWTGRRFFERNRFFAGIGVQLAKTRFEIGYINQYTPRTERDLIEHILTIYLFY